MIPANKLKIEKRQTLVENIESLVKIWYKNNEIWDLFGVHRNVISWLRIKKSEYPISLKKLEPLLEKSEEILEKVK